MTDKEILSWIKSSEQRQEILSRLEKPKTPSNLASELDVHIQSVSRNLSKMEEKEVVELINPEARKGRLYQLTDRGAEYLSEDD